MPVTLAEGHKAVLIYPGAWLGISFVMLVLFVLVFTNARARGREIARAVPAAGGDRPRVQMTVGWNEILQYFPLLLVHMNLAFYLLFSGVLLAAWLFVVFGADRSVYWEFGPGLDRQEILVHGRGGELHLAPGARRRARATTSSCTACWGCGSWASAPATSRSASARPGRAEGLLPEERVARGPRRERDQSAGGLGSPHPRASNWRPP